MCWFINKYFLSFLLRMFLAHGLVKLWVRLPYTDLSERNYNIIYYDSTQIAQQTINQMTMRIGSWSCSTMSTCRQESRPGAIEEASDRIKGEAAGWGTEMIQVHAAGWYEEMEE